MDAIYTILNMNHPESPPKPKQVKLPDIPKPVSPVKREKFTIYPR
jgi:hypothetical protein